MNNFFRHPSSKPCRPAHIAWMSATPLISFRCPKCGAFVQARAGSNAGTHSGAGPTAVLCQLRSAAISQGWGLYAEILPDRAAGFKTGQRDFQNRPLGSEILPVLFANESARGLATLEAKTERAEDTPGPWGRPLKLYLGDIVLQGCLDQAHSDKSDLLATAATAPALAKQ